MLVSPVWRISQSKLIDYSDVSKGWLLCELLIPWIAQREGGCRSNRTNLCFTGIYHSGLWFEVHIDQYHFTYRCRWTSAEWTRISIHVFAINQGIPPRHRIEYTEQTKDELGQFQREDECWINEAQISIIDMFMREYHLHSPICWYTRS